MQLKYICRHCGHINIITSFWKWLITPHFGAKKYLKCEMCQQKRHFMCRKNWTRSWLDWPGGSDR